MPSDCCDEGGWLWSLCAARGLVWVRFSSNGSAPFLWIRFNLVMIYIQETDVFFLVNFTENAGF